MRTRLGNAVTVAAFVAVSSMLLGAMPASAQEAQPLHLDLIVLTRTAGTPTTGERWEGSAYTNSTGEEWTLVIELGRWGDLNAVCGRQGTWRLDSTTNPGDYLAGSAWQFDGGYLALGAGSQDTGRFAGLRSVGPVFGSAQPGWIPVFPGLWQLGGSCGIGSHLAGLLPPLTQPLQVANLAHILPIISITTNVPIAIGSLRFDLVPK